MTIFSLSNNKNLFDVLLAPFVFATTFNYIPLNAHVYDAAYYPSQFIPPLYILLPDFILLYFLIKNADYFNVVWFYIASLVPNDANSQGDYFILTISVNDAIIVTSAFIHDLV